MQGGKAELEGKVDLGGWLHKEMVYQFIQVLPGPSVGQLC